MSQSYWENFRNNVKKAALNSNNSLKSIRSGDYNTSKRYNSPIIPNMVSKMEISPINYPQLQKLSFKNASNPNLNKYITQMDQMLLLNEKLRQIQNNNVNNTLPYLQSNLNNFNLTSTDKQKYEKEKLINQILSNRNLFQDELQSPSRMIMNKFNEFMTEINPPPLQYQEIPEHPIQMENYNDPIYNRVKVKKNIKQIRKVMLNEMNRVELEQDSNLAKLKHLIKIDIEKSESNSDENDKAISNMRSVSNCNNDLSTGPSKFKKKKSLLFHQISCLIDEKLKNNNKLLKESIQNVAISQQHLPIIRNPLNQSLLTPKRVLKFNKST